MVFSSISFLCVFLPVVYLVCAAARSMRVKNVVLVIASFLFYAYGEPTYVLLMLASTLANYAFGRLVAPGRRGRRAVLALCVVVNLGLLGVFKYTDMVIGTLNSLLSQNFALTGIELPIGISFYTFQAMSYVIDVYREDARPQRSFLNVALYISFFPQLIAGPIVKYHDIDRQIDHRRISARQTARGASRFILGLSKKVLIANTLAAGVDALYALPLSSLSTWAAWTAAGAYMLQIYFDFSGYSDMAIGLGHMFGFRFEENFNYPYSATTMKAFWRRWHMSLTTWFKLYLYIPLGGNRKGRLRTCLNKLLVFFATGLWHGANWTFVLWGMVNGGFLLLEDAVPAIRKAPRVLGHAYAILVVCVAFVLFRSDTVSQGFGMIGRMFSYESQAWQAPYLLEQLTGGFVGAFLLGCVLSAPVFPAIRQAALLGRRRRWIVPLAYVGSLGLLVVCMASLSASTYNPFIYFRF